MATLELAECAVDCSLKLEPHNVAVYVLLLYDLNIKVPCVKTK